MSSALSLPHATLRFVEHEGYVWYMEDPVFDNLVVQPLPNLELPIIRASGVHLGYDGVRIGYRFAVPRELTTIQPNYLIVSKGTGGEWQPYYGLPGLQVYLGDTGVALISTRITRFFRALE